MDENLCICCGAVIPEGRQICMSCVDKVGKYRVGVAYKNGKIIGSHSGTLEDVTAWADRTDADEIRIRGVKV